MAAVLDWKKIIVIEILVKGKIPEENKYFLLSL